MKEAGVRDQWFLLTSLQLHSMKVYKSSKFYTSATEDPSATISYHKKRVPFNSIHFSYTVYQFIL